MVLYCIKWYFNGTILYFMILYGILWYYMLFYGQCSLSAVSALRDSGYCSVLILPREPNLIQQYTLNMSAGFGIVLS